MATIAIIGGGISGLSCAYYLKTLGLSKIKYIFLLDKNVKFGGWIQTTRFPDGAVFEHGPRTLRVGTEAGYNALTLAENVGLSSRILPITRQHPVAKTNFVLAQNQLNPLPRGLLSLFVKTPPFSQRLISYVLKEYNCKGSKYDDESVYSFAQRRIGDEIAKYVFDPICRGIAAGDARELSVRSMFPSFYKAEIEHGSVIKGVLHQNRSATAGAFLSSDLVRKSYDEVWRMWTLKGGLTELIDGLACAVEKRGVIDLIFDAKCKKLLFKDYKAEVIVDGENIEVDHVFSCIPSHELAPLVASSPALADELMAIPSVDVAVVHLEYQQSILKKHGFGFLAPSVEDSKVLGIVFDSCCFPELNGLSHTRITCMIGGKWFKDIFGNPDTVSEDIILQTAIEEAGRHLGINDVPVRYKVVLQRKCIPQYIVGHHKRLEDIEKEIKKENMSLSLLGASYKGAGVPDCIYNAKKSVEDYLKTLL